MEITSFANTLPPADDIIPQLYPSPYPELLQSPSSSSSPLKKRRFLNSDATLQSDAVLPLNTCNNNTNINTINNNNSSISADTNNTLKDILASFLMFDDDDQSTFNFPNSSPIINNNNQQVVDFHVAEENFNVAVDENFDVAVEEEEEAESSSDGSKQTPPPPPAAASSSSSKKRSRNAAIEPPLVAPPQPRRLWVKDRSKDWWDRRSSPDFPPEEFKRDFRMSKATFQMICDELDPVITKKDTTLRAAIPVNQRVAVCIWRLATGEPLRLVSKRFGLGISTCHKLVLEVCAAIKSTLMARFLQWPDDARISAIKQEYEALSGIPNVGGSLYTTHIPIIAPKINVGAYFNKRHTERNQKTSYSITVQGVVDPDGVFTDVCIGWPGSMPDDKVLEQSALCQRATRGLLNNIWMVGNSGYPLTDWVLVPYTHQNLTWTQHAFNEKIGEVLKVGANAFGRLKKRWACLQKRTEVKLQELPVLLGACCVLHNICEMRKEGIEPEIDNSYQLFDDVMVPQEHPIRSAAAVQARDHIAHNLLHHRLPGSSFL
ncbi:Protein ALP1-like [Bienertia sinuspersici]